MKAPRPQRCPRRRIRASYLQHALHVGGAIDVRLPMVFCRFLLWPRVRSPPRHARVQMPKGLGESLLQLLAFCDVMTGRLGCGPSVQHRRDRFACKFRMDLKESIEPQEPCSLRPVAISPAAHSLDMLAHGLAQNAAERLGPAQCGKRLIRHW